MHGRIYIILKESLRRIPVIGWGMQFYRFIFLKRNWELDKPRLAVHMQTLNKPSDSMWLMIFPEGTNLAPSTREASRKWANQNGLLDMRYQLLPRSTGLQFCLKQLRNTVEFVYDCTIAYEGVR
jgi:1-acyl-sn-glycerol-3-phosphate acyltransferase